MYVCVCVCVCVCMCVCVFVGALLGIMLTDYYAVRRQRLDLTKLYKQHRRDLPQPHEEAPQDPSILTRLLKEFSDEEQTGTLVPEEERQHIYFKNCRSGGDVRKFSKILLEMFENFPVIVGDDR